MSTTPTTASFDPAEDEHSLSPSVILAPIPPKIIRALRSFTPHTPEELPFSTNAFFYVVAEAQNRAGWYEACHPVSNLRGIVPKSCFEEFAVSDILAAAKSAAADALMEMNTSTQSNADPVSANPPSSQMIEDMSSMEESDQSSTSAAQPNHQSAEGSSSQLDNPFRLSLDFVELQTPIADETSQMIEDISSIKKSDKSSTAATQPNHQSAEGSSSQFNNPFRLSLDFVELQTPIADEPFTFGGLSEIIARGELPTMDDWKNAARGSNYSEGSVYSRESITGLYSNQPEGNALDGVVAGPNDDAPTHVFPSDLLRANSGATTPTQSRPSTPLARVSTPLPTCPSPELLTHLQISATTVDIHPQIQQTPHETTSQVYVSPSEPQQTDSSLTVPIQSRPSTPTTPIQFRSSTPTTPIQSRPLMPTTSIQSRSSTPATPTQSQPSTSTQSDPPQDRYSSPTPGPNPNILPPGLLMSAKIVGIERQNEQYWFQIEAAYLPDGESSAARSLIIFRLYKDFYDFQLALMDAFPVEAGRECGPNHTVCTRKLPFMPRPEQEVNDTIDEQLRTALDDYLDQLCELVALQAEHVLRHEVVRSFFTPKCEEAISREQRESVGTTISNLIASALNGYQEDLYDTGDHTIDILAALSLGPKTSRNNNGLWRGHMIRYSPPYLFEFQQGEESFGLLEEERRWAEERSRHETSAGQHPYSGLRLEPLIDIEGINSIASSRRNSIISSSSPQDGLCVVCQDQLASMAIIDCGHLALCKPCSETIMKSTQECPLCRTFIINEGRLLRIFKT